MIDLNDTGIGGVKEAVMIIKGRGAYSCLEYESESIGPVGWKPSLRADTHLRATVAVPGGDGEVDLDPTTCVDVYRSSGHGDSRSPRRTLRSDYHLQACSHLPD